MKKIIIFCCLIIVLAGCATGGPRHVQYPNAVTPEAQAGFQKIKELYLNRKFAAADSALASFITDFPYTELTDEARFLRGEIAFAREKYSEALVYYRSSFSQISSPEVEPKARFKSSLAYYRMGKYSDALSELSGIDRSDASAVLRLRADSLGAQASKAAKMSRNESTIWYLNLLDDYAEGATKSEVMGVSGEKIVPEAEAVLFVKEWINDKSITANDVETLPMKQMKGKRSGGFVLYKLALAYHTSGDTKYATRLLKDFLSSYPKHEYYAAARQLMTELGGEIGEAAGIAVGVVLPLSGRFGVYGESVLHGVECAIGLYQPCVGPSGVRLVVRDTASMAGGAEAAVEDIAKDNQVVAIIGPLESAQAITAARKAQELGIPLVSLSQMEGVVEIGDYTFRNSDSVQSEISTLVDYMMDNKGWKRFLAIYPENRKGAEYYRLFSQAVKEKGGKIVLSKSYKSNQLQYVNELRGRGAVELATEQTPDFDTHGASFDAIFIPDSPWVVGALLQMMALSGDRKIQLVGISRWNDLEITKRGGEYIEGALFVSSFFKEAPDPAVSSFVTNFRQAYNVEPTLLEALGFDTMRMITTAATERGASRRNSMRDALANTSGFSGIAGQTTFDEQGDAKRRMWVLTVSGGRIKAVQ